MVCAAIGIPTGGNRSWLGQMDIRRNAKLCKDSLHSYPGPLFGSWLASYGRGQVCSWDVNVCGNSLKVKATVSGILLSC